MKTINNTLLKACIPSNYRKSLVGMDTELSMLEAFDGEYYPSVITVRLISHQEMSAMQGSRLMQQYFQWVSPVESAELVQNDKATFGQYRGVSLRFAKNNIDHPQYITAIGEGRVLEAYHICLTFSEDFYLDIIANYDSRQYEQVSSLLSVVIDSIELNEGATLEKYQQLVDEEMAEAEDFINKTKQEKERRDKLQAMCDALIKNHQLQDVVLTMNDDGCELTSTVAIADDTGRLSIITDSGRNAEDVLSEADYLLTHVKDINQRSKAAIVDKMLDVYNLSWTDESLNRNKISSEAFLDELSAPYISLSSHDICLDYRTL